MYAEFSLKPDVFANIAYYFPCATPSNGFAPEREGLFREEQEIRRNVGHMRICLPIQPQGFPNLRGNGNPAPLSRFLLPYLEEIPNGPIAVEHVADRDPEKVTGPEGAVYTEFEHQ